ncbi:MAG: hypothetical protein ACI8O8_000046 [Oleiphilaceae bacterium]|jgi:hypothetical protein
MPDTNLFEGSTITVGLKATQNLKEATFIFIRGESEEVGKLTVNASKKKFGNNEFKSSFDAPDVPIDADSYPLKCNCALGDNTYPMGEWVIWRSKATLLTKKKVDGDLTEFGGNRIKLEQNGGGLDWDQPSTGEYLFLIPKPAPIELKVFSPFRFVAWTKGKDKGAVREMEIEVAPCVAKIITPLEAIEPPSRQYVNVPKIGNKISLQLASVSNTDEAERIPNQDLWVEVEFTNPTKRGKGKPNNPHEDYKKERSVENLTDKEVTEGDPKTTVKGKIKTDAEGNGQFNLYLGKGGSEVCSVKVGSSDTVEDDERSFESWRKLFIQPAHTGNPDSQKLVAGNVLKKVTTAYESQFIELDYLDSLQIPSDLSVSRGSWIDGAECGRTTGEKFFYINTSNVKDLTSLADKLISGDPEEAALTVCLIAVDQMFERSSATSNAIPAMVTHDGKKVLMAKVKGNRHPAGKLGHLPKKISGVSEPRASYNMLIYKTEKDKNGIDRMAKDADNKPIVEVELNGDIPRENIIFKKDPKGTDGEMWIILPDEASKHGHKLDGMNKICTVYYDAVLIGKIETSAGLSDGGHSTMVCPHTLMWLAQKVGRLEFTNTYIHEIGHAIGMCGDTLQLSGIDYGTGEPKTSHGSNINLLPDYKIEKTGPEGKAQYVYTDHGRAYQLRDHQGGHCANGGSQNTYDSWNSLDSYRNAKFNCAIFGAAQIFRTPTTYCARCHEMLMAMEIWVGEKNKSWAEPTEET